MIARINTQFACSPHELWERIMTPASLRFVTFPLLGFTPLHADELGREWQVGVPYHLKLYLLNFIPLGRHTIELTKIDPATRTIESRESGQLIRVWNHTISFQPTAPGTIIYTDQIEIQAGFLTAVIWLFAQLFYRYRQRRWKILLRQDRA